MKKLDRVLLWIMTVLGIILVLLALVGIGCVIYGVCVSTGFQAKDVLQIIGFMVLFGVTIYLGGRISLDAYEELTERG